MPAEDYIEKELISKRSCMAAMLILIFAVVVLKGDGEGMTVMSGIVGTVVGYYFGTHQSQTSGGE